MTAPQRALVHYLLRSGAPLPPLTLLDIGCSGGIHPRWRAWGASLSAIGVDVIEAEIERLATEETEGVEYVCARIGQVGERPSSRVDTRSDYALHRSQPFVTAMKLGDEARVPYREHLRRAAALPSDKRPLEANYSNVDTKDDDPFYRYYADRFSGRHASTTTDRILALDDLAQEYVGDGPVDVIKIDVDGWELDVLRGAERTLTNRVLAVEIEVQFTGRRGPEASVFSNVDAVLRSAGLSLVDLQPVRYSRAALPQPFVYELPAQTVRGPIVWADALYLRDILCDVPDGSVSDARKLACIADMYGFSDWAAELVLAFPGMFAPASDMAVLNHLASTSSGTDTSYEALLNAFERDPLGFGRHK